MRVFVTGGTGLVGNRLIQHLQKRQDKVVLLTRRPEVARQKFGPTVSVVEGDPTKPDPWMDSVAECDAAINLAGENVFAKRWSDVFKNLMRDSRIKATENVVQALTKNRSANGAARTLVNASAIGYYGFHDQEELTEESPPGNDYLAKLCVDWEQSARAAESAGVRVVMVRIGVVLDKEGGALAKLITPFKLFAGGPAGSGKQWMSWIHHEDLIGMFLLALDRPEASGPFNGTGPNPSTNREFSGALGRALHRPSFFPTPAFGLRLMLGEVAEVVVKGQKVLPKKALGLGYHFRFPHIDAALMDLLA
jgi:uncharacterized protein (TIGR01777 family)